MWYFTTTTLLKFLGHIFWVSRVYSLKLRDVVTQIFEIWVSTIQFFFGIDTSNPKV